MVDRARGVRSPREIMCRNLAERMVHLASSERSNFVAGVYTRAGGTLTQLRPLLGGRLGDYESRMEYDGGTLDTIGMTLTHVTGFGDYFIPRDYVTGFAGDGTPSTVRLERPLVSHHRVTALRGLTAARLLGLWLQAPESTDSSAEMHVSPAEALDFVNLFNLLADRPVSLPTAGELAVIVGAYRMVRLSGEIINTRWGMI